MSRPPAPPPAAPAETALRRTLGQAGRYLIGAFIALGIDVLVVQLALHLGGPVLLARSLGLLAGVTTTYAFNRRYTFTPTHPASLADWGRYVLGQSVGTALNFAVSTALLYLVDRSVQWQVGAAILAGAAIGFIYNFFAARRNLQRPHRP